MDQMEGRLLATFEACCYQVLLEKGLPARSGIKEAPTYPLRVKASEVT